MNLLSLNDYLLQNKIANLSVISCAEDSYALMDYLIQQFQLKLGDCRRHKFIADRYFKFNTVTEIINSGSLFDDAVYIEINYKTKPTVDQQKEIIQLVEQLNDNTHLLITTDKLTKTDLTTAWMKLKSAWYISINDNSATEIVQHILSTNNLTISNQALNLLLELNQKNSNQLLQEVNKLSLLFTSGHQISLDDIKSNGLDNALYNIYQLNNAYLSGNLKQAITILNNVYTKPEDAILIQWLIGDDLKKIIRLKAKLQQNYTFNQVSGELKIWGSNSHLYQNANSRLSYALLIKTLDDLAMLDMAVKGLIDKDIRLQLINILTKLCSKNYNQ